MSYIKRTIIALVSLAAAGCSSIEVPQGVEPVKNFELNRYIGRWYEIARLDHQFERGLINVTADYSMRDDGGVKVINRGYNSEKKKWNDIEGKAYFTGDQDTGRLKVSFFGPFYGAYNIIELDKTGYQYALVCGPDRSYLWILARRPDPEKAAMDRLVQKAASLGFDTRKLIYVKHGE